MPTPWPILRYSSRGKIQHAARLVESAANQPYLVAPGKLAVQKLPDFKMTSSKSPTLAARIERWPIAGSFTISRGAKTEAVTVVAEVSRWRPYRARRMRPLPPLWRDAGGHPGRPAGDAGTASAAGSTGRPCRPPCRQAPPATRWIARCWTWRPRPPAGAPGTCSGAPRPPPAPPPTPSRWEPRRRWRRRPPRPRTGRCSRSSSAATATARESRRSARRRPESELIVDANEAWTPDNLEQNLAACAEVGVTLVEQPLPAGPGRGAGADRQAGGRLRR